MYSEVKYGGVAREDKAHFCGKCLIEMLRIKEKESFCEKCQVDGHDIIYKCPECGYESKIFEEHNMACT